MRFRRFIWRYVLGYEGEICQRCGRPVAHAIVTWWNTSDMLWGLVVRGRWNILCPRCYTREAGKLGITIFWQADVEFIPPELLVHVREDIWKPEVPSPGKKLWDR